MSINQARSLVANEVKKAKNAGDSSSTESVENARRALAEAKLEDFIRRTLARAPTLTDEQLDRLARLLSGGGAG